MESYDDTNWGSDVPISLPVPPKDKILVDMGTFGFTVYGMNHNLSTADLENFVPTFVPGRAGGKL